MKKKGNMMHLTYEHKPVMTLIGFSTLIRMEVGYSRGPVFCYVENNREICAPVADRTAGNAGGAGAA